jgi:hypothetical protein
VYEKLKKSKIESMAKKTPTKKKTVKKKDTAPKSDSVLSSLLKTMKPAHIRFVYLYLGGEDGKCFNNATLSYLRAFDIETSVTKDKDGKYSKEYLNAKVRASELLTNRNIQELRNAILLESGFEVDSIKKRFAELAYQNKNLPIALTATDRIAKISGVLKEESKVVDIPQLTELTEHIKAILTP